jgi:hypothetical protein
MNARTWKYFLGMGLLATFALGGLAITGSLGRVHAAQAASQQSANSGFHETTSADQTDLAVTVYNSNVALVRDTRDVSLPSGDFQLRFMDIAATVNPATVHMRSLGEPDKVNVLEQNYEYDLLDANKLLEKYVGKEVTILRQVGVKDGVTQWETTKATLLALNNGGPVWKIGDSIETGVNTNSFRFPSLPENLYSRPTLVWTLSNTGGRRQKIEASYLANSISWNADYVMTVTRDENAADLDGWVTLVNGTGTGFHNAKLQLVAGELNRVAAGGAGTGRMVMEALPAPQSAAMTQENFSEYHLYTLNRRTTIFDKETKQVSLLRASSFPVSKHFVVNGQSYYYRQAMTPGAPLKDPVMVYYTFKNEEKTGLGMPLPAGTVRVYQADSHGGVLFIGEDNITHTPKDESISIHIGNAFDIVAEHKQTDYKSLGSRTWEVEYEVTLRNHKDGPVTIEVNEPIGGDWEMLSSTFPAKKTGAFAAQFNVPVAKDGTAVLKYRVRVRY